MAEWILVFAPDEVNLDTLGDRLSPDADIKHIDETTLDVVRSTGHVQIFVENTAEMLVEHENAGYDPEETARIVAQSPNLAILRICYYRGTELLHATLCALSAIIKDCFIDNDDGVVEPLDVVLERGLPAFLASHKPRAK